MVRRPRSPQSAAAPPAGVLPLPPPRMVARPPTGEGWRHEIKLDGYRMQLRVGQIGATWYSRNGNDWTARLLDLADEFRALGPGVFDGELCVLNGEGSPDFSALRSAMGSRQVGSLKGELTFFVFDRLFEGAEDLRPKPLAERHARLDQVGVKDEGRIQLTDPLPGGGPDLLTAACRLGLEGIVSKRLDAPYEAREGRRADSWVKAKCRPAQEVLVGGWEVNGSRFRSLLVGVYEGEVFRYVGAIGTGFSAGVVADLLPRLRTVEADRSAFQAGSPPRGSASTHWTRPELVAAAEIAEWTAADQLSQASFKVEALQKGAAAEITRPV